MVRAVYIGTLGVYPEGGGGGLLWVAVALDWRHATSELTLEGSRLTRKMALSALRCIHLYRAFLNCPCPALHSEALLHLAQRRHRDGVFFYCESCR